MYYIYILTDSTQLVSKSTDLVVFASEGESVNISVTVMAYPQPGSVVWHKLEDFSVNASAFSLGHNLWLYYLTVDNVASEDFGLYACEISNGVGDSLVVQISLKRKGNI